MRLINSDGQITDARVMAQDSGNANSNNIRFELGGLALVACIVVMLLTTGIAIWALADSRHTRDLGDARYEALERSFESVKDSAVRADRDATLLAYYVNEVDGKLIHAGFIEPRERWSPTKRKQYEEKHP